MIDLEPLWLTFRLASITAVILFFLALPLAYWLAFTKNRLRPLIEALVALPLVLPPTVLGFYLLLFFSPKGFPGRLLEEWGGIQIAFTFTGLVMASLIYSLPFMVQSLQAGFGSLPYSLVEASYTLGKGRLETVIRVLLPNMKGSLLTGIVLSFAHTVGEFGVVLMIGGNIPGVTRVASIAIYDEVQALNYRAANFYSLLLLLLSFGALVVLYGFNYRRGRRNYEL